MTILYFLVLLETTGLAWYDFRHQRIPNLVTLFLLMAGWILHFPGAVEIWLGCFLLFIAWHIGWLGGGDAKLWMAMLWLVPPLQAGMSVSLMFISFLVTGGLPLAWREVRGKQVTGIQGPGTWRVIPFAVWLLAMSIFESGTAVFSH
ncbi:MAG: prepilin peptidase [Chloroflexi bacterium]|nr:prepilin peptidase [Chloroflexota bacterium]